MTIKSLCHVAALAVAAWTAAATAQDTDTNAPDAETAAPAAARGNRGRGGGTLGATLATQMLLQGDKNGDQKLSQEEFSALADAWFERLDPDHVGRVSQEEFLVRFEKIVPTGGGGGVGTGAGAARGGRGAAAAFGPMGFFTVLDQDDDTVLRPLEIKQAFDKWFGAWDTNKTGWLDRARLVAGLNATLPRTNLGGSGAGREEQTRLPGLPPIPASPPLPPAEALKTIHVPKGFKVELTASEPLIEDPIMLSFDEDGRLYVTEMRGFMPDIDRTGERQPTGRVTRLEDTKGNGHFDKATVFVDGLVLPRGAVAIAGGLLYISDFKLYYAQDTNGDGIADHAELVDAAYGPGNVEHSANGLMRAMDNWIYNGDSAFRYRFFHGTLVRQRTEFRGQWGMSQDNYGRLIYDVNNSQLLGDYTPPNYMSRNPDHQTSAGLNLFVATDQRVFPIRMTTAVNRGYQTDVLDTNGRAYVFASSCCPVVFRGDTYPADFVGNAFVCDPAVNLIKRNVVFEQNLTLTSKFAYSDSEFLASTDERFRPVSTYNGPDGTLWVVDMYRGIIQYGQFMTSYLRQETLDRGLDKGIHFGRIYRVVSTAKSPDKVPKLSKESPASLAGRLSSPNGWIRDTAQRLLVERGDVSVTPRLVRLVTSGSDPLGRIHALWTLEGLYAGLPASLASTNATTSNTVRLLNADANFALDAPSLPQEVLTACFKAIGDVNPKIQSAAIRVAESLCESRPTRQQALLQELAKLKPGTADEVLFQAALTAGNLPKPDSLPLLARVAAVEADRLLVREAVMSGLQNWELQFLQFVLADPQWASQQPGRSALLSALASAIIKERQPTKMGLLLTLAAGQTPAQAWRQKGLLEGIAANVQTRAVRPVPFDAAPAALELLAKSDDPQTRQQAEKIMGLFSWPGHQSAAAPAEARPLTTNEATLVAQGKTLFLQVCAGCHGLSGQGLKPMAPPLVNSDWVLGPESRLIRIALHGVGGPIKVNGTVYQPPNVLPEMPALGVSGITDAQLASILSYIRRDWGHEAAPVAPTQVTAIRKETQERKRPWNEEQLLQVQ